MAEIEIHHEHGHEANDPLAKRVGLLVGLIGVVLAFVTIVAHREHTAAVLHRSEANDSWSYYQAKKIREHMSDVAAQLAGALGSDAARVQPLVEKMQASRAKYLGDAEQIQKEAEKHMHDTEHSEQVALRFDLAEGFLELGLVLSSLYFLGRQKLFPAIGASSALVGAVIAVTGFLI